jgi:ATP-dependent helicase/nuclease subunit B
VLDRYTQGTQVTANSRLSRQLRRYYDAECRRRGVRVWESPDILPRSAWLARLWQECAYRDPFNTAVLLNPVQEHELWDQAIAASAIAHPLLDLPASAATAAEAWSLVHRWEVVCDAAEFDGLPDAAAFIDWMHAVQGKLRENGWITASELPRALLDRVQAGIVAPGAVSYAGFDELAPADRRLFEACAARQLPQQSIEHARRYRVAFHDSSEELIHAAAWARRMLEEKPDGSIGIVVPGLAGFSVAAERIFSDIFHPSLDFLQPGAADVAFHVSAGARSADVPLISVALLALGLKSGVHIGEMGMLLRSPFLRFEGAIASRLIAELRRQGAEKISLEMDTVRSAFPLMGKAAHELPDRQYPSEWSAGFSRLLDRVGWPGERMLSRAENQIIEHWKSLLSQLASLDLVMPRVTYDQALQRLQRIAYEERFRARDEGAPVQIIDLQEAVESRFDALWVAGLHGGAWPGSARPNSFLPLMLQRAAGMPHSSPERELAYSRRATARLLASAPEVVCSYPLFSGEERLRISPLIEELPELAEPIAPFETPLRSIFLAAVPLEQHLLGQAPPVRPGGVQGGGMRVLEDQAACPFRAFAIHRLRARQYDPADIGISPSERGTVAHEALEYFWREIKSQRELNALSEPEIAQVIENSVSAALNNGLRRRHKNASLERSRSVEQSRLERLIKEWLLHEKGRTDFTVVEREAPRRINAGGLELDVKVDRIDQQAADGTYVVLDYKTSENLSRKEWDGDRPDAPQLPLYAVKSGRKVSGAYFAKLVPGKTGLSGYEGENFAQRLPDWERVIDQLGASFLQGDAAVDPKNPPKTCEFCDLHSLCRIGDLRRPDEAEEEAGE